MILIGQYDSPFVRRVGIALVTYGIAFEHRPWSVFGDSEKIARYNPLRRVPTLVLDDGMALLDSATILLHLDEMVGPDRALIPASGPERRRQLRLCALAAGLCEKMVALIYERVLHETVSKVWIDRCNGQIHEGLAVLEGEMASVKTDFVFGATPGHADIAIAAALRFLSDAHPAIRAGLECDGLAAHLARCEERADFLAIRQAFIPPA
ncbi:glutathione S-transferase family protein [Fulvimarina endophytica]|uniref:Glutathione S-transferase family protein n=1 Tax=Fulvimarina endophytica TaxID=2293836 RepID=A0A371WZP6_9HYPH|nr:glutathione S-transferase family protein [Fulvimarina endophytica]RFC62447.1 glutathione S-transferase family protein [Fulvimarina endophytica]